MLSVPQCSKTYIKLLHKNNAIIEIHIMSEIRRRELYTSSHNLPIADSNLSSNQSSNEYLYIMKDTVCLYDKHFILGHHFRQ